MSAHCPNPVDGFGFSHQQIKEAVARRGLLSMEIEFSRACNFRCPYCYNSVQNDSSTLGSEEIDSVFRQAREMGAEKIILLGGEPMIYPLIREKIKLICDSGMRVEMFTNGSCITEDNARFMYEHGVAVVLKLNSFDPDLQNQMTGRTDAHGIIWSAFERLRAAGYPASGKRLAVSTVITRQNLSEMIGLWRWLRSQQVEPYFEMITPQGRAVDHNSTLEVSPEEHRRLFDALADIDRREFNRHWQPQPPLVGNSCLRHQYSCLVNAKGEVMPCVGVTIPLGSIRQEPLRKILGQSEVMENLRNHKGRVKEPCGSCAKADVCYGCRGAAYQLTGDYLAADPMCWLVSGGSIQPMPANAEPFLPHQPPIRLVERIVSVGERTAELELRVPAKGSHLVDEHGVLEPAACIEIVAQAFACMHGFHPPPKSTVEHRGYLLSAKGFEQRQPIRAGDRLQVRVRKLSRLGSFGVGEGVIMRDGQEITRGEVNIYQEGGVA